MQLMFTKELENNMPYVPMKFTFEMYTDIQESVLSWVLDRNNIKYLESEIVPVKLDNGLWEQTMYIRTKHPIRLLDWILYILLENDPFVKKGYLKKIEFDRQKEIIGS